ncbi:MAG TPA: DEAD/DEAH box helicase, partial [Mycobacteriales bacterium]|nr:DEAD/DEAH box helicase [Mycobacteriales bacterium]
LVRLRTLIEEARALNDGPEDRITISRFQAGLFDDLAELGVVKRQSSAWKKQVEGLRSISAVGSEPVPPNLQATLRPYQHEGFAWLATLWTYGLGGILADDMGLGKTLQSLALICHARAGEPFLIVAPSSVVPNWVAEAARFAPGLRVVEITDTLRRSGANLATLTAGADIVVTSYTLFRLDFPAHSRRQWAGLILDEAQYVKNHQGKTYSCARRLTAPFKLAITGTPMENNLMELWSLLSITAPGLFPDPERFAEYYAQPIEKGSDPHLLGQLRHRIAPLVKRRTKELVAPDLPAKQEQIIEVPLHPRHRTAYQRRLQRERQKVLGLLQDVDKNRFTILRSLTVLRQLSLHAGLVEPEHDSVPCAKLDTLMELLRDVTEGGHRALVFSQFTGFLAHVRRRLDSAGVGYCYLDGRTRKRAAVIEEFKNGADPVFLISLKAGGFGLNLTEADYCFLLDPWWNPATEAQAVDRTHRIGQTRNVMVYRLLSADTIEQKVMDLKERKAKLFTSVMDDGNAFNSALSADDIRGLLD